MSIEWAMLRWLRRARMAAVRWVFGDHYQVRRRHAARLQRRTHAAATSLLSLHQVDPQQPEQWQVAHEKLRALALASVVADQQAEASKPLLFSSRRLLIVALALVTVAMVVGLLMDASAADVELRLRADRVAAVLAERASLPDQPVRLSMGDVLFDRLDLLGVHFGGEAELLDVVVESVAGAGQRGQAFISELSVPRGMQVEMHVVGRRLTIMLAMPPGAPRTEPGDGQVEITLGVGAGYKLQAANMDGEAKSVPTPQDGRSAPQPVRLSALASPDQTVTLTLVLSTSVVGRPLPLLLQNVDLGDLQFEHTRNPVEGPMSAILGGVVQFPNREIAPVELTFREMLRLSEEDGDARPTGQIRRLTVHVPADGEATSPGDPLPPGSYFDLHWAGEVPALLMGQEGRRRSAMPSALLLLTSSKTQLYMLGVVIYAGIFISSLLVRSRPGADQVFQPTDLMS